jgi:hypothetical protein
LISATIGRFIAGPDATGAKPMKWLLFAMTALIAIPAHADWQFTRWGMTPDQVVAASKGAARLATEEEAARFDGPRQKQRRTLAVGSHTAAGIALSVRFVFENNRLVLVSTGVTRPEDAEPLRQAMLMRYGQPAFVSRVSVLTQLGWSDRDRGNKVELIQTNSGNGSSVNYSPLSSSGL